MSFFVIYSIQILSSSQELGDTIFVEVKEEIEDKNHAHNQFLFEMQDEVKVELSAIQALEDPLAVKESEQGFNLKSEPELPASSRSNIKTECPYCNLCTHLRRDHGLYKCELCPKTYSDSSQLSRHVKWTHTFRRSVCSKKLTSQKNLAIHETMHEGWTD